MDTRTGELRSIVEVEAMAEADRKYFQQIKTELTPVQRRTMKIGRNELCPCGSGKKFKRCCFVGV